MNLTPSETETAQKHYLTNITNYTDQNPSFELTKTLFLSGKDNQIVLVHIPTNETLPFKPKPRHILAGSFVNQKCAMKIGWEIDPINGSARLLIKKRDNAFLP